MVVKDGMPVTSIVEGNHFGEVSAIFSQIRTASILTETECTFLVMTRQALYDVLCSHFRLAADIEEVAAKRLNSSDNVFTRMEDARPKKRRPSQDSPLKLKELDDDLTETALDLEVVDFTAAEFELDDDAAS